ncbi:ABC transporter permease [Actinomadura rupiterrae]|uniref:ABC transporter permease n=1 Tax=Actinomadura rupiterrae TaxID=559627 RepID=UPI0020A4050B|nr:ABC transporter permease [Actinomadura rupiterrae]MCP2343809.1 ABC-2 type transport system permease protein [Actinomadura rupiterrae]
MATQMSVLTVHTVRTLLADRRLLLITLLEPLPMLLVFGQALSGLARVPGFPRGVAYIDYLVPALMVTTALQSGLQSATRLTDDLRGGLVSRFRAMPLWLGSVLVAQSATGLVRGVLRLATLVGLAWAVFGYRCRGGPLALLLAVTVALAVAWALGWAFMALACWFRRAETLQAAAGLAMFPLMFASNAFLPVAALPPWLRVVAQVNPLTHGVAAVRALTLGRPALPAVAATFALALLVTAVAAPIAIRGVRRTA